MTDLRSIAGLLNNAKKLVVAGHVMPDGDCVGSVKALGLVLGRMGKDVTISLPDPVPEIFSFLPGVEEFVIGQEAFKGQYDFMVVLDCSVPERLGTLQALLGRPLTTVNIDHHAGSREFAHYNYISPSHAATAEIIQDLIGFLKIEVTSEIATCLYTGIVTDTGSFQYENTTPETHRRAASLMEQGASSVWINLMINEQKPLINLLVLENTLKTLELSPCGRVAWVSVERGMLDRLNARDENTDGLINYIRSIRGVEVAIFFHEISSRLYKVGFRSKEIVDVNRLASLFGGGGHIRAAGCVVNGNLESLQAQIVSEALKMIEGTKRGLQAQYERHSQCAETARDDLS
ncbi:MAG: bifunctional oligoribonuclease/PAP phosphatase NrnA [Eubacteriales bacterium]|jgi:phosphoesterase RecJ-like protein